MLCLQNASETSTAFDLTTNLVTSPKRFLSCLLFSTHSHNAFYCFLIKNLLLLLLQMLLKLKLKNFLQNSNLVPYLLLILTYVLQYSSSSRLFWNHNFFCLILLYITFVSYKFNQICINFLIDLRQTLVLESSLYHS